jgi:all-trans-retinol 13,14-reductase
MISEKIPSEQPFDAIVIGSGIGGLTVAAILSELNQKRVLVLEQHFTVGGLTHEFSRKSKFNFDVGLHYIGGMEPGGFGRKLFDFLTHGNLKWNPMPDIFERFVYPDFTFDVPSNANQYKENLIQMFPDEQHGIVRYFSDIQKAAFWYNMYHMIEIFPFFLKPLVKINLFMFARVARMTTKSYLDNHFKDTRLKAILASQWGDYGLPPSKSSFGIHALIVKHYLKGGWYPEGGAREIAKNILPGIQKCGGKILLESKVTEIIVRKNKAIGVKVVHLSEKGPPVRDYFAPVIISDAGAYNTYLKLLPENVHVPFREDLKAFLLGYSALALYVGFKESPEKLGFKGENYWVFPSYDHESILKDSKETPFYYLSFPSLKDPSSKCHTAEVIIFTAYELFSPWNHEVWRKREKDYYEMKKSITEMLIDLIEKRFPGFKDLIEFQELSTPLTVEYFQSSPKGAFYGIPAIPERLGKRWVEAKAPIKNLYLTGQDVISLGIVGAMMGGVKTAGLINGPFGFFKVMAKIQRFEN